MINQSNISFISNRLTEPETIAATDKARIDTLVAQYPYFLPARYLAAAYSYKFNPDNNEFLAGIYSNTGNWMLLCELLDIAAGKIAPKKTRFAETENTEHTIPEINNKSLPVAEDVVVVPAENKNTDSPEILSEPVVPNIESPEISVAMSAEDTTAAATENKITESPEIVPDAVVTEAGIPEAESVVMYAEIIAGAGKDDVRDEIIPENIAFEEEPDAMDAILHHETVLITQDIEEVIISGEETQPVISDIFNEDTAEPELVATHENSGFDMHEPVTLIPITESAVFFVETQENEDFLIPPVYTEDYFLHQGILVTDEIEEELVSATGIKEETAVEKDKALMVMMSFTEWLMHYKTNAEQKKTESEDKKALNMQRQKERLAKALEEEDDEIPEGVFEMAMNSITREDDIVSESLAEIYTKQKKYDLATNMYQKLSLRNPEKSTYFAAKIEEILKEK